MTLRQKRRLISLTIFLTGLALSSACGPVTQSIRSDGYTYVSFNRHSPPQIAHVNWLAEIMDPGKAADSVAAMFAPVIEEGIMAYAVGVNGTDFVKSIYIANEETSAGMSLPNGEYNFLFVGYKSDPKDATATPVSQCGAPNNTTNLTDYDLSGTPTTISVTLNPDNCDADAPGNALDNVFDNAGHHDIGNDWNSMQIIYCANGETAAGAEQDCVNTAITTTPQSYLLEALIFEATSSSFKEQDGTTVSSCAVDSDTPTTRTGVSGLRVQAGINGATSVAESPFAMRIQMFTSDDCSGTPFRTAVFDKGLKNLDQDSYSVSLVTDGGSGLMVLTFAEP